ncbi:barstar family protein [Streptomyces sp. CC208A]|uniref:barstar family protein n=1 Tax=Streptomyces sp. CC208A TaxID=3044573 RepID=UPI0024A99F08|nr:barstar family protein [Streptomyces sp. CC208A]
MAAVVLVPRRTQARLSQRAATPVTDVPGLHRVMAEALVGPGGCFGREWNAFKDCLGGFGVALPFTRVRHEADTARRALADVVSDPDEGLSSVEDIVRLLRSYGATVVLQ